MGAAVGDRWSRLKPGRWRERAEAVDGAGGGGGRTGRRGRSAAAVGGGGARVTRSG